MTEDSDTQEAVVRFRKAFRADRIEFVKAHGPMAFDQARTLYVCGKTGRQVVVTDAFYGIEVAHSAADFIEGLSKGWWPGRTAFNSDDPSLDLVALAGVYARFLPEVGYDYTVEFDGRTAETKPERCWRVEAGGKASRLDVPMDEGMLHGQTGTFYNVRAGWRWLCKRFQREQTLQLEEVEPGYFIGVRRGVPNDPDPAGREDEALQYVFSRHREHNFDTLEFLGSPEASQYPFEAERYGDWLGPWVQVVQSGDLELFALADSDRFVQAVEELCEIRDVVPQFCREDDTFNVRVTLGELALTIDLGFLFLRGLHTGRSHMSAARDFVVPSLDALAAAHDLYGILSARLPTYETRIEDGAILVVLGDEGSIGRWNLLNFVGLELGVGSRQAEGIMRLIGFDPNTGQRLENPVTLDTCVVCGEPARVGKVLRPTAALGVDPRTLVGVPIGDHTVYYTLDCPTHSIPVQQQPDFSLAKLEERYVEGLGDARFHLVHQEQLSDGLAGDLIVGFDAGSLVLEPRRIKGILELLDRPTDGDFFVYGLYPDAFIIAHKPIASQQRRRIGIRTRELLEPLFPGRLQPLDIARKIQFDEASMGQVEHQT